MKSSAKEMVMFRNSRKGYDKNDVNRYIEDMNIRFTTAENRYISTVRMLEQDIEKYKADAGKAVELESAKRELEEAKAQTAGAVAVQFKNQKAERNYVETAVMFARDFSKLTSNQVEQLKELLRSFEVSGVTANGSVSE